MITGFVRATICNRPVSTRSLLVTPLLFLALVASVHAEPLLSAPFLSFDTGQLPWSVAIADLNADGRPDLVTANWGTSADGNTVSVLLGNGDGTFGAKTDFGTGTAPSQVAIADLNADGRPDLAVAGSSLSVLLGNGDGTFGPKTDFGPGGESVAVGDLNGDGRPDLAVESYFSNTVSVLLGNGDGTFGPRTSYPTGPYPHSVAIADLNADGRPDLAVTDDAITGRYPGGEVSVLLGNGDGTFGPRNGFVTGSSPQSVAIADLNADGRPDLATANWGYLGSGHTVSVMLGNGDGTFGPATDFATSASPVSVAIADMNADGRLDLAVASGSVASVLLGNGDGTFGPSTSFTPGTNVFGVGGGPSRVAIADLNADGRLDLAVAAEWDVWVVLGNGDGRFGRGTDLGTGSGPNSVAIADLNHDGRADLAVANRSSNTVSVLLGNGDGTFRPKTDFYTIGYEPRSVAIADVNADGRPDLMVANFGPVAPDGYNGFGQTVSVLLGNGDGTFGPTTEFYTGTAPLSVAIADLNGDGRPDLATANYSSNTVSVLMGNGDGTFGPKTDFGVGSNPNSVAIGDLNFDGRPDLAVANSGSFAYPNATVSVLLGNGDGTFANKTDFGTGIYPTSVAIADLNADGRPDLAVASGRTAYPLDPALVSVLLGNGDGTFGPKTDFGTSIAPTSVAIADLNADGSPDLAVVTYANTVSVLLGNGDGMFKPKTDFGTRSIPRSVAIADLNADGLPDLAVANSGSNTVSVMLHASAPCSPTPMSFDLDPNTLDLQSPALWVTATLEPEPPALPAGIDIASIRLNGSVPVDVSAPSSIGDVDHDGRPDLTVKLSRIALEQTVPDGDAVPVTVSGRIGNGCFEATQLIRVIHVHVTAPTAGSVLPGGSTAEVRWDTPAGIQVQSVAVLTSSNDGATWNLVAHGLPNTGSYLWTVPGTATSQARIAVVLVESADASGFDVVGVLGMSGRFSIECSPTPMSLELSPNTLNLKSQGQWVTATLEPESPASPVDIDIASIRLNGSVPVDASTTSSIGDANHDHLPDLTVKFNRVAFELTVPGGDAVPVTVSGMIGNGCFTATATIRVVHVSVTAPSAGSVLQSGSTAEVRWDTPNGITVQSVAVLFSSDDGATWNLAAHDLPNTGSALSMVPGTATDQARVAVVLVESADPDGYDVVGVVGVSDRFAIASPLAVGGPSAGLSLSGSVPNPSSDLSVSFSLPDARPARLVVYDVSGREVSRRDVGSLGAGRHVVTLGAPERLAPGIYLVHLVHGDHRLVARAAVVQ